MSTPRGTDSKNSNVTPSSRSSSNSDYRRRMDTPDNKEFLQSLLGEALQPPRPMSAEVAPRSLVVLKKGGSKRGAITVIMTHGSLAIFILGSMGFIPLLGWTIAGSVLGALALVGIGFLAKWERDDRLTNWGRLAYFFTGVGTLHLLTKGFCYLIKCCCPTRIKATSPEGTDPYFIGERRGQPTPGGETLDDMAARAIKHANEARASIDAARTRLAPSALVRDTPTSPHSPSSTLTVAVALGNPNAADVIVLFSAAQAAPLAAPAHYVPPPAVVSASELVSPPSYVPRSATAPPQSRHS